MENPFQSLQLYLRVPISLRKYMVSANYNYLKAFLFRWEELLCETVWCYLHNGKLTDSLIWADMTPSTPHIQIWKMIMKRATTFVSFDKMTVLLKLISSIIKWFYYRKEMIVLFIDLAQLWESDWNIKVDSK